MSQERDYVLGTHDEEIERLGLQHRVWTPRASAAWQRAGFSVGQKLLDVGCGPGYATLDLAKIVGPTGRIFGIDRSRRFLDHLEAEQKRWGIPQISTIEADLDDERLGKLLPANGDGAWCRWVFAFVKHPRALLGRIAGALRPGAPIVIHEYFHYRTWRFARPSEAHKLFVEKVVETWRDAGGEPDIGLPIISWLGDLGLSLESARPMVEVVRPGDYLWQWPKAFVEIGAARMRELGTLSAEEALAMRKVIDDAERDPNALMILPGVIEIIATRNR